MKVHDILSELPPYEANKRLILRRQDTYDIIRDILRKHSECAGDYDKISKDFWRGNVRDTCRALFDFCKDNIKYHIEPTESQSVKTPAAILSQGQGDCKHYSLFINGVLHSLQRAGYPVEFVYRFASYDPTNKHPRHVFSVCKEGQSEIWTDPVLPTFDNRKSYYFKLDKVPTMGKIGELYDISGIDAKPGNFMSGHCHHTHWLDTMPGHRNPTTKHHYRPDHKGGITIVTIGSSDIGRGGFKRFLKKINPKTLFLKASMAPSRNSFLLLLKMNLFDLAYKLAKASQDPKKRDKLKNTWEKLGGTWKVLAKNINQGVRVYEKHRHKKTGFARVSGDDIGYTMGEIYEVHPDLQGIGVIQFAGAAAIIAAASPIIAALRSLLKSFGIKTDNMNAKAADGMQDLADGHNAGTMDDNGDVTHPGSGVVTQATDNGDGTSTLHVKSINHSEEGDDGSAMPAAPANASNVSTSVNDTVKNTFDNIKSFVTEHKKAITLTVVGIVGLKVLPPLIHNITGSKPRRRR